MSENDDWTPVGDGEPDGFNLGAERAPWVKWILSLLLLGVVAVAAVWLISTVITPDKLPQKRIELPGNEKSEAEQKPPKTADDEAWVRALEKDTLEGYREYLTEFPDGRHKDKAQEAINVYDNKDWATAERRNTISGYEDYLAAWPDGLHASKAQERIDEMKAAIAAASKDAAEKAAAELRDWDKAAQADTIPAYEEYLGKHPAEKHAGQARERVAELKAAAASAEALAIEEAAWQSAKTSNTASGYETYLASYPNGKYVPLARAALEELQPSPGKTFRDCDVCPLMMTVPGGNANLGAKSDEAGVRPNEQPQRPVIISRPFSIGVTEVTFDQWNACVSAGGCDTQPANNGWGAGKRPVINVSWDDAQKYTSWLSQKTGKKYSLPSEAQWEYAARGGETGLYVGGSQKAICAFANGAGSESGLAWSNAECNDLASDRTLPAGSLSANKFGLKDMIGNVAEWTLDCNTLNLRDAPTNGEPDLRGSCNQRAVRGGSWFSGPADLRYAARLMQRRGDSNDFTGFRVVRNP
ncbi:MAG: formylglycine-generating enzyme family protein [Hellea sp.]|nr:formylglycine-generating enzyme family protein [Hellea sp.]